MKRSWNRSVKAAALALGLLVVAPFAQAETKDAPAPTSDEARAAFVEGRSLMSEQKWSSAAEQFSFAARARNTPGLRYYIGYCLEQDWFLVEALESYREAAALLKESPAADVQTLIPEAIERIEKVVPRITLDGVPEGTSLRVDGTPRELTTELSLNPGKHTLRLEKEGHEEFVAEVLLKPEKTEVVRVRLEPVRREPGSGIPDVDLTADDASGDAATPRTARKAVFWTSAGVGAAGLGAGIVGAVLFSSAGRNVDSLGVEADNVSGGGEASCADPTERLSVVCADLEKAGKRHDAAGAVMVGGFVAAGAGVVGAIISHYFWPEAPLSVDVGALPSPRGSRGARGGSTWLNLRGRF